MLEEVALMNCSVDSRSDIKENLAVLIDELLGLNLLALPAHIVEYHADPRMLIDVNIFVEARSSQ